MMRQILEDFVKIIFGIPDNEKLELPHLVLALVFLVLVLGAMVVVM